MISLYTTSEKHDDSGFLSMYGDDVVRDGRTRGRNGAVKCTNPDSQKQSELDISMYATSDMLNDSGFLPMYGDNVVKAGRGRLRYGADSSAHQIAQIEGAAGAIAEGIDGMQMQIVQFDKEEFGSESQKGASLSDRGPNALGHNAATKSAIPSASRQGAANAGAYDPSIVGQDAANVIADNPDSI